MPFFSVVVPTYNRAGLIVETINSVLAQTYSDFEIVVVDDGSTDDTQDVVQRHFANEAKLRYVRQLNAERGAARNNGFKQSHGLYVVFFDSDDLMHEDHLATLAEITERYPNVNFLATKYKLLRDGKIYPSSMSELKEGWHGIALFLHGNPLACNVCVRKDNEQLKLFVEDRRYAIVEDWMFLAENIAADKIYIDGRTTISLVDHANRSMRGDNREIIEKHLLAREWLLAKVDLTAAQRKTLEGHSDYFCAVHNYVDNNRINTMRYLFRSSKNIGVNSNIAALFIKNLIGYNLIRNLRT